MKSRTGGKVEICSEQLFECQEPLFSGNSCPAPKAPALTHLIYLVMTEPPRVTLSLALNPTWPVTVVSLRDWARHSGKCDLSLG